MKIKYLIIVSLILAIITVGAVSASENITDDDLAVEEVIDDSVEVADESVLEIDDSNQEELGDVPIPGYSSGIDFGGPSNIVTDNPSGYYFVVSCYQSGPAVPNELDFYVNDNYVVTKTFSSGMSLYSSDLNITEYGDYKIDARYGDKVLKSKDIYVSSYGFDVNVSPVVLNIGMSSDGTIQYGDTLKYQFNMPSDASGKLSLTVNGKTYDVALDHGRGQLFLGTDGWKLGDNVATAKYTGDSKYDNSTRNIRVNLQPRVSYPNIVMSSTYVLMSVGEDESISIVAPSGTNGTVQIAFYPMSSGNTTTASLSVENGYAAYSLSNFTEGSYIVTVNGQVGDTSFSRNLNLEVITNDPQISTSAPSEITEGSNLNVAVSAPLGTMLGICVDNNPIEFFYLTTSEKINELISGLTVGTHKIKVFSFMSTWYSNSFIVNVKKAPAKDVIKLTLSKVKVKKSAKKLVIKATLKINGKAKKGLKVKFKFNKKTYSAKTNYKGIAKVTIKKAVLKKLKAGRKLTYQASYGKTVKKITVKVLK